MRRSSHQKKIWLLLALRLSRLILVPSADRSFLGRALTPDEAKRSRALCDYPSPGCCMRLTWGIGRDRPRAPCSALDGSRPNAWRGGQTSCMNSIADRLPDRPISSRSQPIGARERETDRGEVRAGGGGGGTRGIPPSQGYRGHGHAGFIPEIPNRRQ